MSKGTAMADVEEEEEKSKNKKQRFDEPCASLENLPFDSVMEMEILPRLPLKSILRLELASKPLSPLISDHLRRRYSLPNAVAGLFFFLKNPSENLYHALNSKFIVDGALSTLPPNSIKFIHDCCNGLLLCRWSGRGQVGTLVCNPLTGQCASIPKSSFSFDNAVLAFDPRISGHYNILHFCSGKIDVFSSEEAGSWVQKKQAASHSVERVKGFPFFFNGKVCFPSYRSPFANIFDRQGKLVGRINLPDSEEMGFTMKLPAHSDSFSRHQHFAGRLLGHSGGHLHFAVKVKDKMLVWIIEDCEESRWVLKHNISLRYIFDDAGLPTQDLGWTFPQVFHPDMDVIFIQVKDKIFSYNMDNNDFTEVCTHPMVHKSVFAYSPCYSKDFDL